MELMRKSYSGESLVDIERDVSEAVQEDYNHLISHIPKDEYGFQKGCFTVVVEWHPCDTSYSQTGLTQ